MRPCLRIALALSALAIPMFAENTAVLPFPNISPSNSSSAIRNPASMDWIGESIAETLRAAFAARGVLTLERDRIAEAYRRLQLARADRADRRLPSSSWEKFWTPNR